MVTVEAFRRRVSNVLDVDAESDAGVPEMLESEQPCHRVQRNARDKLCLCCIGVVPRQEDISIALIYSTARYYCNLYNIQFSFPLLVHSWRPLG